MAEFFLLKWFNNISLKKKLFFMLIVMTLLVTIELLVLGFATATLSGVRAYVSGEGQWSKSQKDAVYHLQKYGHSHSQADYETIQELMKVPLGDMKARKELEKKDPDLAIAYQGFLEGKNHPSDIEGLIKVFKRFRKVSYIDKAIGLWRDTDPYIDKIITTSNELHTEINSTNPSQQKIDLLLENFYPANQKLTQLSNDFSSTLGEGARWLEGLVVKLLFGVALMVEFIGLFLTFLINKGLQKGIKEINIATKAISEEDFNISYKEFYHDEIGTLASSLNKMSFKLQENIKERKKAEDGLKRETNYLSLMQKIAFVSNESTTFEYAAKECIDRVCEILNWPIGHLYIISDKEEKKLISTQVWHLEDEVKYKDFKKITEDTDFYWGSGLPGRVMETGQPTWILDVSMDNNFSRKNIADPLGIKSAFAFPIILKNEVVAVMEFFSLDKIGRDEYILKMSYSLGTQLGRTLERQKAQDKLRASEEQTRAVVNNAYDAFVLIDDQGMIKDWNPQAEQTFGWKREEALGLRLSEVIIPQQYREAHEAGMKHFNKSGEGPVLNRRLELSALHRNGNEFPIELTISAIKTDHTHVFAAFLRDISQRKLIEENLKQAKERAEDSEKIKELFLANMSHEIRTPMNAIVGFSRILENTELTTEQKESVHAITQSGENLMVIINDILDFSKIEAGKIIFENTKIDLQGIISSTITMLKPKYNPKNLKVNYVMDPKIPPVVIGDKVRLTQILINLISNAIKFTLKGEVNISVGQVEEDAKSIIIRFNIKDTGIGIEKEKMDTIFESFTQARFDTTRKYGGTGLGLSIVKKLVELQNGTIHIESEINTGSTFSFTLPFLKADIKEDKKDKIESIKIEPDKNLYSGKIMILLAEDNPINQLLALRVINKWGFEVDIAENGLIAIDKLKSMDYDLILMDLQMPEMDGYEATKYIRENLGEKKNIPILAMTAHAIKGEIEKCLNIGMNDYISKPFEPNELYSKIIHLYEMKEQIQ